MSTTIDLLERPLYSLAQVDRLLALRPGTAHRWIDGYERRGRNYPPVVRLESTGSEIVTWGEFVESRLLAEYRDKGVPLVRMRPAIEKLRKEFGPYPLAKAKPLIQGKELVRQIQEEVGLDSALQIVVIRSGQLVLSVAAEHFLQSVQFSLDDEKIVERIYPFNGNHDVVIDPLRQFGEPVVRSVPTEVIAEEFDAGDSVETIAELYELRPDQVEAALRYERQRIKAQSPAAA
jgi:uncharacterized protein (DUF433 family)